MTGTGRHASWRCWTEIGSGNISSEIMAIILSCLESKEASEYGLVFDLSRPLDRRNTSHWQHNMLHYQGIHSECLSHSKVRIEFPPRRAGVLIGFQLKGPRRSSRNQRCQKKGQGNKHSGTRRVSLPSNNSSPKQRPFWQMGAPTQQLNLGGFRTRKAKLAPKGFAFVASVVPDVNPRMVVRITWPPAAASAPSRCDAKPCAYG
jgi:hypothetical protein